LSGVFVRFFVPLHIDKGAAILLKEADIDSQFGSVF
jgi:hypothetical protein